MNRSSKGFGLAGVLATVVFLIVAAIFSASAKSQTFDSCMLSKHGSANQLSPRQISLLQVRLFQVCLANKK